MWNAEGRKAIVAIPRTLGWYVVPFSFYTPMAIRNDNDAYDMQRVPDISEVQGVGHSAQKWL
jgi:hypothetical protein